MSAIFEDIRVLEPDTMNPITGFHKLQIYYFPGEKLRALDFKNADTNLKLPTEVVPIGASFLMTGDEGLIYKVACSDGEEQIGIGYMFDDQIEHIGYFQELDGIINSICGEKYKEELTLPEGKQSPLRLLKALQLWSEDEKLAFLKEAAIHDLLLA